MSPKRKDPTEPYVAGGWVGPDSEYETEIIKVKAPHLYADAPLCNCRVRLALVGPSIVEREVRRAKKGKFLLPKVNDSEEKQDLNQVEVDITGDSFGTQIELATEELEETLCG